MKTFDAKNVFRYVLAWLEENVHDTSKIAMQKSLFYLEEKGIKMGLDFEPYSYGPFSRKVMEIASELEQNNEISIDHEKYRPINTENSLLEHEQQRRIKKYLDEFRQLLNNEFSFDNLELYGTTLYCIRALQENGLKFDKESVIHEFKAWKGHKYHEAQIEQAYEALTSVFTK
jgi:uncharacterized protein YwgA